MTSVKDYAQHISNEGKNTDTFQKQRIKMRRTVGYVNEDECSVEDGTFYKP